MAGGWGWRVEVPVLPSHDAVAVLPFYTLLCITFVRNPQAGSYPGGKGLPGPFTRRHAAVLG